MKRHVRSIILILIIIFMLTGVAQAGVTAIPNQQLSFRTGPNTKYGSLFTLPQSTRLTAIEYEEGNGVTWVLVAFNHNGMDFQAYTGLKRMDVLGSIPWANHSYRSVSMRNSTDVFSAPSEITDQVGHVFSGDRVTLLRYDDYFAFIEFYDSLTGALNRGWVYDYMINDSSSDHYTDSRDDFSYGVPASANQTLSLRTGPNTAYTSMGTMPQTTSLIAYEGEEGNGVIWILVEYMKDGKRYRGYTGLKRLNIYGDIYYADHEYEPRYALHSATIQAAPSYDGAYRGKLQTNDRFLLLGMEGMYAFIEFTDPLTGSPSRGYIPADVVYVDYYC